MKRWFLIALALAGLFAASFAATLNMMRAGRGVLQVGSEIAVPSGQKLWFLESLSGESAVAGVGGSSERFRFVAPAIARDGGTVGVDQVGADLVHLCGAIQEVIAAEGRAMPTLIVIAVADRETEFGVTDPSVTRYFEAFRIEERRCIAEVF